MARAPGISLNPDGKSVTMDAVAVVAASAKCYACGPRNAEARAKRALCIQRQAHHPRGPIIPHDHILQAMRMCTDCRFLVVG